MKKTATVSELAEILGVTRSAISQAVASGRLSRSLTRKNPKHRLFEIHSAVLEWENGRDNSQVRDPSIGSKSPNSSVFPPVAESRQVFEYYQAMNEQISALRAAGKLVDLLTVQNEVFSIARVMRDRLLEIPEKRRFQLLATGLSDADTDHIISLLNDDIHRSLLELSNLDLSMLKEQLRGPLKAISDDIPGVGL
jgi:phage terminase Nu1 subunit (DNA packaging protein)